MPIGPISTPRQKQEAVHRELSKFKKGQLHSGSSTGPIVTRRDQAIAIALNQAGLSNRQSKGRKRKRAQEFD